MTILEVPEQIMGVGELTNYLEDLFENDRNLQQISIIGEVSSINYHARGTFLTLKDADGSAAIKAVVWKNQQDQMFYSPKQGEEIVILGNLRLFRQRGEYQVNVFQILPGGEGLQGILYQQLRSKLAGEGLFDSQRKRPIPRYPQTIAVVTSATAAAWGDIQKTIAGRYMGVHILLAPATVQGIQAPSSIVAAIERVNRDGRAEVIILTRGGGAVEDLSCFNDEKVVRAIADSTIPVITGIGHQRDESLADLAADMSVHTPTAAAELVTPDYQELFIQHQQRIRRAIEVFRHRMSRSIDILDQLRRHLKAFPHSSRVLLMADARCQLLREKLLALDPQSVLKRGYSVVRIDRQILRSTANLVPEEELTIQLEDGSLQVKITEILS
jgi:exodeoxyribonuclease VII large subunit